MSNVIIIDICFYLHSSTFIQYSCIAAIRIPIANSLTIIHLYRFNINVTNSC